MPGLPFSSLANILQESEAKRWKKQLNPDADVEARKEQLRSSSAELDNLLSAEKVINEDTLLHGEELLTSVDLLDRVRTIVQNHPILAKKRYADQGRLLHHLADFGPSLEVVETIFYAFPQAIYECNTELRLPLHLYTMKFCDPLVVEFLVQKYPLALSACDVGSNLPIHWLTGCHFSFPQVTQLLVQLAPESVEKRITFPGGRRRTILEAALMARRFLTDDAALLGNEASIRILVDAYPQVLEEMVEYDGSESKDHKFWNKALHVQNMSSLHLHSLLHSKPTSSLVELFLSNFSGATLVRDDQDWTILMHGQLIERLPMDVKRLLIRCSVQHETMSLMFRSISPELARVIMQEADDHLKTSRLELYVKDGLDVESHNILFEALGKSTTLTTFSLIAPARYDLPMSASRALSTFFDQNTPLQDINLDVAYHSSAFVGLCNNSNLQSLSVHIQNGDNLLGLAAVLRRNNYIVVLKVHVDTIFPLSQFWDALRTNTSVKILHFQGAACCKDMIVDILANDNTTIRRILHVADDSLNYYCRLNQAGRTIARKPETTKAEFVNLLRGIDEVEILYGLLQDVPALWSH
jgi:hypothetical protein